MLNNQTMTTLTSLGLRGMADAFGEQLESVQYLELSFEERFGMLAQLSIDPPKSAQNRPQPGLIWP